MRNDAEIQQTIKQLFLGCAPERRKELEALWDTYRPEFQIHDDNHEDGPFIFDAGAYRYVRFNARATRLFWLGAYIAWEGFSATPTMATQAPNWSRLTAMLGVFDAIYAADAPEGVALPPGVPEPGTLPAAAIDVEGRAVAELAIIATGWALLHEVRHIRHQQDGTSTNPAFDPPGAVRGEEQSCDHYATLFLTAKINAYARQSGDPADKVRQKRQLGVYFALFTIALVCKGGWGQTDTHPALRSRLQAAKKVFGTGRVADADEVAALAFQALRQVWPGAPAF